MKFKADKDKYKLTTQQFRKKYLERIRQKIQKKNVSINETAVDNNPRIEPRIYWRGSRTVMQHSGGYRF